MTVMYMHTRIQSSPTNIHEGTHHGLDQPWFQYHNVYGLEWEETDKYLNSVRHHSLG